MAEREDERPLPGRLVAPSTVSCRALFLAFLIYQRSAPHCAGGGPNWCYWPGASRCISGTPALQEVAAKTMQLVLEFGTLNDAGLLLVALPGVSPPGGNVDPRLLAVVVAVTLSPGKVAECMISPPAPTTS